MKRLFLLIALICMLLSSCSTITNQHPTTLKARVIYSYQHSAWNLESLAHYSYDSNTERLYYEVKYGISGENHTFFKGYYSFKNGEIHKVINEESYFEDSLEFIDNYCRLKVFGEKVATLDERGHYTTFVDADSLEPVNVQVTNTYDENNLLVSQKISGLPLDTTIYYTYEEIEQPFDEYDAYKFYKANRAPYDGEYELEEDEPFLFAVDKTGRILHQYLQEMGESDTLFIDMAYFYNSQGLFSAVRHFNEEGEEVSGLHINSFVSYADVEINTETGDTKVTPSELFQSKL